MSNRFNPNANQWFDMKDGDPHDKGYHGNVWIALVYGHQKQYENDNEILPATFAGPGFFEYAPTGIEWSKPLGHHDSNFVVLKWYIPEITK